MRTQQRHLFCKKVAAVISRRKIIFPCVVIFILLLVFPSNHLISLWIEYKVKNVLAEHFIHQNEINEVIKTSADYQTDFVSIPTVQSEKEPTLHEKLLKMVKCYDRSLEPSIEQHGNFWVLSNYVRAEERYRCHETITYTTQGDYTFLDNLIPLVRRWKGPVSVALHAPGTDFQPTLDSIAYLRNCKGSMLKEYVTFHLLFDMKHVPTKPNKKPFDQPLLELYKDKYDCSKDAPFTNVNYKDLYKIHANISYPINVARNVARERAQTHFVLASDIELYPSLNIIDQFLHMVVNKPHIFVNEVPGIFVLPVFEVMANESAPENKKVLQELAKTNRSISFHKNICNHCHGIPQLKQWLSLEAGEELGIFATTKRVGKYKRWEAVYIGTNEDPFFDESLDWERHGNKMAQAYALCLLNYDYKVLDNAFLVHKPGIKMKMVNAEIIPKTAQYLTEQLGVQFEKIYGNQEGCEA